MYNGIIWIYPSINSCCLGERLFTQRIIYGIRYSAEDLSDMEYEKFTLLYENELSYSTETKSTV